MSSISALRLPDRYELGFILAVLAMRLMGGRGGSALRASSGQVVALQTSGPKRGKLVWPQARGHGRLRSVRFSWNGVRERLKAWTLRMMAKPHLG